MHDETHQVAFNRAGQLLHPLQFVFNSSHILNQHIVSCYHYFYFLGRTVLIQKISCKWRGQFNYFLIFITFAAQVFQFFRAGHNFREQEGLIRFVVYVVK